MTTAALPGPRGNDAPGNLETLRAAVEPHAHRLREHPLYADLSAPRHVRVFMQHHVFAVWDFMCLLKALQGAVTCTTVPWVPRGDPETRRFVNQIVVGEESDETAPGRVQSHFEMYLEAMREAGADTRPVDAFIAALRQGHPPAAALERAGAPRGAAAFVLSTLALVDAGRPHAIAAAFTLGREAIIPGMFLEMVRNVAPGCPTLVRYLERHIDLDASEHGPLADRLLESLCGNDAARWNEASDAALGALQARQKLWDSVHLALTAS